MALFAQPSWYWFDAWIWQGGQIRRIYTRGPMYLTSGQAQSEYLDTFEAFPGGVSRMFRWTGSSWQQQA